MPLACLASLLMKTALTYTVFIAQAILIPDSNGQMIIILVSDDFVITSCTLVYSSSEGSHLWCFILILLLSLHKGQACYFHCHSLHTLFPFRATNAENMELNKVKNQLTGEYGEVPATARYYKVRCVRQ